MQNLSRIPVSLQQLNLKSCIYLREECPEEDIKNYDSEDILDITDLELAGEIDEKWQT